MVTPTAAVVGVTVVVTGAGAATVVGAAVVGAVVVSLPAGSVVRVALIAAMSSHTWSSW